MIIDFWISCVRTIADAWNDLAETLEEWAGGYEAKTAPLKRDK